MFLWLGLCRLNGHLRRSSTADLTHPQISLTKNTGRPFECSTAISTALVSDAGKLRWNAKEKMDSEGAITKIAVPMLRWYLPSVLICISQRVHWELEYFPAGPSSQVDCSIPFSSILLVRYKVLSYFSGSYINFGRVIRFLLVSQVSVAHVLDLFPKKQT